MSVLKSSIHAGVPKTSALSRLPLTFSLYSPPRFCLCSSFGLFWTILKAQGSFCCSHARILSICPWASQTSFWGIVPFPTRSWVQGLTLRDFPNSLFSLPLLCLSLLSHTSGEYFWSEVGKPLCFSSYDLSYWDTKARLMAFYPSHSSLEVTSPGFGLTAGKKKENIRKF